MQLNVKEIQARNILTPQKLGSLAGGYDYSLNPYAGCAFACSYCYVPKFPNAERNPQEWGTWVNIKINAPQLIRAERLKVFGSRIFFSSATDPYQYLELRYRLSRRCLQELLHYQPAKVTMHTRSHLLLQDIDLLKAFKNKLRVGVSITTDDDTIRKKFEPNAPSVSRRLQLLRTLREHGIRTHVSIAPALPMNAERLIALIKPYAQGIWIDQMRWLEINNRPHLLKEYAEFFTTENQIHLQTELKRQLKSCD